jgi:hypothetical protein
MPLRVIKRHDSARRQPAAGMVKTILNRAEGPLVRVRSGRCHEPKIFRRTWEMRRQKVDSRAELMCPAPAIGPDKKSAIDAHSRRAFMPVIERLTKVAHVEPLTADRTIHEVVCLARWHPTVRLAGHLPLHSSTAYLNATPSGVVRFEPALGGVGVGKNL